LKIASVEYKNIVNPALLMTSGAGFYLCLRPINKIGKSLFLGKTSTNSL